MIKVVRPALSYVNKKWGVLLANDIKLTDAMFYLLFNEEVKIKKQPGKAAFLCTKTRGIRKPPRLKMIQLSLPPAQPAIDCCPK